MSRGTPPVLDVRAVAIRLHHVQVCCPPGGEDDARRFYAEGLGLTEVDKPESLAGRGGVWFCSFDQEGTVLAQVHVGVEDPVRPASRAHPALQFADHAHLEEVARRLVSLGFAVDRSEEASFPGFRRFHTRDVTGNRVELLA